MSADGRTGRPAHRPRSVSYPVLLSGPLRELKSALEQLHRAVEQPTMQAVRARIVELADGGEVSDPEGTPSVDTIHKVLTAPALPANVHSVIAVAAGLLFFHPVPGPAPVVRGNPEIEQIRRLWAAASAVRPAGVPIGSLSYRDLEVHDAIELADVDELDGVSGFGELPVYVRRAHDEQIHEVVRAAMGKSSRSGIAVLVSDSTSGKTRALFEALHHRGPGERSLADEGWSIFPALNPMAPQRFLDELTCVGARTVVWLNEAHRYLIDPSTELCSAIADALRELLADSARRPVLLLGTLWPQYWSQVVLQARGGGPGRFTSARILLTGTNVIRVHDRFDKRDQAVALETGDPRLRWAVETSKDGAVTQNLAGVPDLMRRFDLLHAGPRAVIFAAMDARRLGHGEWIAGDFLAEAAQGYLDDREWRTVQRNPTWFAAAVSELTTVGKAQTALLDASSDEIAPPIGHEYRYRLDDYLDQHGRTIRATIFPPQRFWSAVVGRCTELDSLYQLSRAAEARGRRQSAYEVDVSAARLGDVRALLEIARLHERAGDRATANQLVRRAADRGHIRALEWLAFTRMETGDPGEAELLFLEAVEHGSTVALTTLGAWRVRAKLHAEAETLYMRAAEHGDQNALNMFATELAAAGAFDEAERIAQIAATAFGDSQTLLETARWRQFHQKDAVTAQRLARQSADLGNVNAWRQLARWAQEDGDAAAAEQLNDNAIKLGDTIAMEWIAWERIAIGDTRSAETFLLQAYEQGDIYALLCLAQMKKDAGDSDAAEALVRLAAKRGEPVGLRHLSHYRRDGGDTTAADQLLREAADYGDIQALFEMAKRAENRGSRDVAEQFLREAIDRGAAYGLAGDVKGSQALRRLTELFRRSGYEGRADSALQFGLKVDGSPAERWSLVSVDYDTNTS